jgi:hypothetical protein
LDTSLVAAFLGEYSATDGKQLSAADLSELRQTLSALASQAEHQALADSFSPTNSDEPAPSIADSSSVHTPDLSHDTSSASASLSSSDFVGSPTSFNSPLGFLQAAFPDVDTKRLRNALAAHGEGADADMETIVSTILSSEYIRELEERGLDDDDSARTRAAEEAPWITAKSGHKTNTPKAPKKAKGRTFTIVDVRQSQHAHKEPARRTTTAGRPAPDPWIQMNSLSTRLADLIPSRPASFFLSLFHNPSYGTFTNAIRAGLATIAASSDTLQTNEDQPALFMLFELLSNSEEYSKLDSEQRATLFSDAQLAFQATNGLPDEALDIVLLLHDLDDDDSGVSHAPPTPISPASTSFASIAGSPKLPASSSVHSFATPSPASPVQTRASTDGWQHIPERRAPRGPNPHTQFIPAYDPLRGSRKLRGMGNGLGKGGKGDVGELVRGGEEREAERAKRRVAELMESRDAALRDATRAWQRGNAKSHGGEVAMFFAERVSLNKGHHNPTSDSNFRRVNLESVPKPSH